MLDNVDASAAGAPDCLQDALELRGTCRTASGRTQFVLDDPSKVHLVAKGRVDVFLVECKAHVPTGPRMHLCTVEAGQLLLGIAGSVLPGPARVSIGFLAVSATGTMIVDMTRDAFDQEARRPQYVDHAAALIDAWVCALSEGAARVTPEPPAVRRTIAPGECATVVAGERVTGSGWVRFHESRALFLDIVDVDGDAFFPLGPRTWAAIAATSDVACQATTDLVASNRLSDAIDSFHGAIAEVLPLMLRLGAADEMNRLRLRIDNEREALERAEGDLAALASSRADRAARPSAGDALHAALSVLSREMGWTLREPAVQPGETPALDSYLRASNLRSREIVLERGWWTDDIGPTLLLDGPDGQPAALLRRGRHHALVGADGRLRRLSRQDCQLLGGRAYILYETLPEQPLTTRFLLRRSWQLGWPEIYVAVGAGAIAGVLALLVPLTTGIIAQDVIPSRDVLALAEFGGVLVVLTAIQILLRFGAQRALLRLSGLTGSRLQVAIMDRVLRLPAGFFRGASAGEVAVRIDSLGANVEAFTHAIMGILFGTFVLLASLMMMLWSAPSLMSVALLAMLVLAALSFLFGRRRHAQERDAVRARSRLSGWLLEVISGVGKVRLAAAENRVFAQWSRHYAALMRSMAAAKRTDLHAMMAMTAFSLGAQAALFATIATAGTDGADVWLGSLVTFLSAFQQAIGAASGLVTSVLALLAIKPALEQAAPILSGCPERLEGTIDPGRLTGAIEIGGVEFGYEAGTPIVSNLSVQIRSGEFVALVGPSGGGKSTILRLLLGFELPTQGAILYDGKDLRSLDLRVVRSQFGVVLQRGRLFGFSIEENILAAHPHLGAEAAWRAAEEVGIADDIRAMPMGMGTVVVEGGLSGGQIQRILLARALVHRPSILLLDEATSALDNRAQDRVSQTLSGLTATRVVVAHRLTTVAKADRILVIEGGTVVESGNFDELLARNGRFATLVARQLA